MPVFADVVRPFWLTGLNQVSGPQAKGIGGVICDEEYQLYSQITPISFVLSFTEPGDFQAGFAGDINRIGSASFESVLGIAKPTVLPRSTAWLVIQTYY